VLKVLIEKGDVKESTKLQYYITQKGETKVNFTDFSEEEYYEAVEYFREWLQDEMESDTPMEKIIVLTLDQKWCKNKDLLSSLIYLSDEFIQLNASGVPIGVSHGKNSPVIELSTINSVDPQELYEFILPKIKEFIKEYGGSFEVSVGRKGASKIEYYVQEK
jgi:hypothetical protein